MKIEFKENKNAKKRKGGVYRLKELDVIDAIEKEIESDVYNDPIFTEQFEEDLNSEYFRGDGN